MKGRAKKPVVNKFFVVIYWLIFLILGGLFFTNDFGLVDIHKTSIITAVGIDTDGGEVQVTAEIAVPQPSQSGENIVYTQVQGSGLTIADAMNEINSKTGFYPKLQFCKLILIGESCRDKELFRVLGCFYRKNYSELTALVAMCEGNASDMLAMKSAVSEMTSEAIRKILSDEVEKSANVTSANLKKIAAMQYSESKACYMPYVQVNQPGTSQQGGNGDNVGGNGAGQGGQGQQNQQSGGQSGQSGQGGEVEFTARKTAYFSDGRFVGVLDEQQSFALCLLQNEIRLAVLPCDSDGIHYTLGLKSVDCGTKLKVVDGVPELTVKFKAKAQIQGARVKVDLKKIITDDVVKPSVLESAEKEMQGRFESLMDDVKSSGGDVICAKELLYKNATKYFEAFKDDLLQRITVKYDIDIQSVN